MLLKYIFNAGDDAFREIEITKVTLAGERARVRVRALRERTERRRSASGEPISRTARIDVSLGFVREGGDNLRRWEQRFHHGPRRRHRT